MECPPNPPAKMDTIDMKRAVALVSTSLAAAWPEVLAGSEMPTVCVQFIFCFHDVNITSKPA
jgi:hypothetical protein